MDIREGDRVRSSFTEEAGYVIDTTTGFVYVEHDKGWIGCYYPFELQAA